MNIVDTSGWIAFFNGEANADIIWNSAAGFGKPMIRFCLIF